MDTHNDIRMALEQLTQEITGYRMVVGAKQLRKTLLSGQAQKVYLAQDADPAITEPIAQMCLDQKVPFAWVRSMKELGRACKIDVGAAAAAATF
jgi:large subunit ribosomal protein L7A